MDPDLRSRLIAFLAEYVTEHKQRRIEEVLSFRTRHLTIALEDIYQSHNASAVVRSCDCLCIQDIHVIENSNTYEVNPDVVLGSSKWVDIHRYNSDEENNTPNCFEALRKQGYQIIGTSPAPQYPSLLDFKPEGKIALIFGTEMAGLSQYAVENADNMVRIPIYGFTESYNISVSAAICLYDLMHKIMASDVNWRLSEEEKEDLTLKWYQRIIKNSDTLVEEFLRIS